MASNNPDGPKHDTPRTDQVQEKTLTYLVCQKHGRRYPKGDRCPECEAEARKAARRSS
jgi:uncharacterized OB-fold protein